MGTSLVSSSQTLWKRCAIQEPNFMALGAEDLSEASLTDRVTASSALMELQISRSLRVCCSTKARREMRRRVTNRRMESSSVRNMLKP